MRRHWKVWIVYAACLLVVIAAISWTSAIVLRMERHANIEEPVRLALWRLDSQLAPIFVEESSRPYEHYTPFYTASHAYDQALESWGNDDVIIPSPLLTQETPFVRLHFQYNATSSMASPQVPRDEAQALATTPTPLVSLERLAEMSDRLAQLQKLDISTQIEDRLQKFNSGDRPAVGSRPRPGLAATAPPVQSTVQPPSAPQQSRDAEQMESGEFGQMAFQSELNHIEFNARKKSYQRAETQQVFQNRENNHLGLCIAGLPATSTDIGVMYPFWIGENLFFARRVSILGQTRIQGCWLDWALLKTVLLEDIADLLPQADLVPITEDNSAKKSRTLAWLPVELHEGEPAKAPGSAWTVRAPLMVAWTGLALAALAVGGLLFGALALSERRASFVSAVTHELRTPLTTFRIYTEMLADKMVTDDKKRFQYLETLKGEAIRLGHMVENVLAYARLEKGRAAARTETISIDRLLELVKHQLETRAQQEGMAFVVVEDLEAAESVVTDVSAFEQILSNLVDNACKHAAGATDKTIHLEVVTTSNSAAFRVRDHGPGVAPKDVRRLFKPFSKSAEEAATSAPGVGLGLALCRRLARAMGGELSLSDTGSEEAGACFELTLPRATGK